ncbi:MAG: hypothetical protein V4520_02275 [Bacteroidota bacterium]
MTALKLTDNHSLLIECHNKKLRLVITDGITELACRKETSGKLNNFLSSTEANLFKGRLQLHKKLATIDLLLKGNHIGCVTTAELKEAVTLSS